tara:strand:+ start:17358 stop:17960 length:603 start_codon:yes stop_codon:yes gene_type:complete
MPLPDLICGECLEYKPPATIICALEYRGLARELMLMFKFGGRLELGRTFSAILAEATTATELYRPERDELYREKTRPILLPVPSAHKRLRERGFSPAAKIALGLGKILDLPVVAFRGLKRRGAFVAQSRLSDRRARRQNVRDAFQSGFKTGQRLPSDIVVVDDVVTTGATAYAYVDVLRRAGIANVRIVAACRAIADKKR